MKQKRIELKLRKGISITLPAPKPKTKPAAKEPVAESSKKVNEGKGNE